MNTGLKILLIVHAIITFAAGIVLIVAPAIIPATVNIHISPDEYLLSYFLGAAELAIACLSFFSKNINDKYALRVIVGACIVFHAVTGVLEILGLLRGGSMNVIPNVILRVIVVALFYYYGIVKTKKATPTIKRN